MEKTGHIDFDKYISMYLSQANQALGRLQGWMEVHPQGRIIAKYLMLSECLASSYIEGVKCDIVETLRLADTPCSKENISGNEFFYLLRAMRQARRMEAVQGKVVYPHEIEENIIDFFLTLKNPHEQNKNYRKIDVVIYGGGKVVYRPPTHDKVNDLMRDFGRDFIAPKIHENNCMGSHILLMARLHLEFESIHPFHDGNGRIGRWLNLRYFIKERLIDNYYLPLSMAIWDERPIYYALLNSARKSKIGYADWLVWMTNMVEKAASYYFHKVVSNIQKAHDCLELAVINAVDDIAKEWRNTIPDLSKKITLFLTEYPVFEIEQFMDEKRDFMRKEFWEKSKPLLDLLVERKFLYHPKDPSGKNRFCYAVKPAIMVLDEKYFDKQEWTNQGE